MSLYVLFMFLHILTPQKVLAWGLACGLLFLFHTKVDVIFCVRALIYCNHRTAYYFLLFA